VSAASTADSAGRGPRAESPHKLLRVYTEAVEALRRRDLRTQVTAAGYEWQPDTVPIRFLGRDYLLTVSGPDLGLRGGGGETSVGSADTDAFAERILILHYLETARGTPLSGRMVGFDQLAGGRFYGSAFRARTELPLASLFSRDPEGLGRAAARLGGGPGGHGNASALLFPFPRVPMTLIVWAGDEELPSNAKVLFDDTAEEYLSTEDIAVLGDQVFRRMREAFRT
jgi:hypothetical protein